MLQTVKFSHFDLKNGKIICIYKLVDSEFVMDIRTFGIDRELFTKIHDTYKNKNLINNLFTFLSLWYNSPHISDLINDINYFFNELQKDNKDVDFTEIKNKIIFKFNIRKVLK